MEQENHVSPKRNEIYAALAKATLEYKTLRFNRTNGFNKQVYADLAAIQDATRTALAKNGIYFLQEPKDIDGTTFLFSTLCHSSGQDIECKSRLIVPGYTGAKSDNQRFGESLAYLKRQIAQSMLGIVADHDAEDNDDADTSEIQYNKTMRNAMSGDATPAQIDQGILSEKITKYQLDDLHLELEDYPVMTTALLKGLEIKQLADMPKGKFQEQMQNIRRQKIALINQPKKEW